MLENPIETKIVKKANELGFYVRKYTTTGVTGSPDRIFICPNPPYEVFFIEFKSTDGRHRKRQEIEQNTLKKFGKDVYRVNNIEYGLEILNLKTRRRKC